MKRKKTYRKTIPKKPDRSILSRILRFIFLTIFTLLFLGAIYHYRIGLAYYLGFKSDKVSEKEAEEKRLSDVRNYQVLAKHEGKSIGLDVSEYQGEISWSYVDTLELKYPIDFVFIRATIGKDRKDYQFKRNWIGAKKNKMIRGAYHYY